MNQIICKERWGIPRMLIAAKMAKSSGSNRGHVEIVTSRRKDVLTIDRADPDRVGGRAMAAALAPRRSHALAIVASNALLMTACLDASNPATDKTPLKQPDCLVKYAENRASNPLQKQLSCGPMYDYSAEGSLGDSDAAIVFVGTGSFCPDSPEARRLLHDNRNIGYLPGYSDACLTVPSGMLFVLWSPDEAETFGPPFPRPPSCPSSCRGF